MRFGRQSEQLPGWRPESDSSVGGTAYLGWCDQSALDIPFDMASSCQARYTLPCDIQVNAALQSYDGPIRGTYWDIGPTTTYAANCSGALQHRRQLVIPESRDRADHRGDAEIGAPGAGQ